MAAAVCSLLDLRPRRWRSRTQRRRLAQLSLSDVRRSITVLFQQPVHYNATAKQNIALGDLGLQSNDSDQAIMKAAVEAGANSILRQLPGGYDQLLGRWFADGAELSVGEWQRIALARAFLRQAPILILDEPTSAMDPWAEADWLSRFRSLARSRTVIMIRIVSPPPASPTKSTSWPGALL